MKKVHFQLLDVRIGELSLRGKMKPRVRIFLVGREIPDSLQINLRIYWCHGLYRVLNGRFFFAFVLGQLVMCSVNSCHKCEILQVRVYLVLFSLLFACVVVHFCLLLTLV